VGCLPVLWVAVGAGVGAAAGHLEAPESLRNLLAEDLPLSIAWGLIAGLIGLALGMAWPVQKGLRGRLESAGIGFAVFGIPSALGFLIVAALFDFIRWEAGGIGSGRGAIVGAITVLTVVALDRQVRQPKK
jgi:hypothetical protein